MSWSACLRRHVFVGMSSSACLRRHAEIGVALRALDDRDRGEEIAAVGLNFRKPLDRSVARAFISSDASVMIAGGWASQLEGAAVVAQVSISHCSGGGMLVATEVRP
jgi:hypothetical protein